MGKRQQAAYSVHFSTDLYVSNQSMAAALDANNLTLEAEESCKRSYSALHGKVTRSQATVTSCAGGGTLFAIWYGQ